MRLVRPESCDEAPFARELNALLDAQDLDDESGPAGSRAPGRRIAAATVRWGRSLHGSFDEQGKAYATDISPHGMGLMAEHAFEDGQELVVDLHAVVGKSLLADCEVVYCKRVLPTMWRIGLHFVDSDLAGPYPFDQTYDDYDESVA